MFEDVCLFGGGGINFNGGSSDDGMDDVVKVGVSLIDWLIESVVPSNWDKGILFMEWWFGILVIRVRVLSVDDSAFLFSWFFLSFFLSFLPFSTLGGIFSFLEWNRYWKKHSSFPSLLWDKELPADMVEVGQEAMVVRKWCDVEEKCGIMVFVEVVWIGWLYCCLYVIFVLIEMIFYKMYLIFHRVKLHRDILGGNRAVWFEIRYVSNPPKKGNSCWIYSFHFLPRQILRWKTDGLLY